MLIHIRPCFLSWFGNTGNAELVDLTLLPFGLTLRGGVDLVSRRPYANKHYTVACRKQGQKAIDGIFIQTAAPVVYFESIVRWAVNAELIVSHRIKYTLLDEDFDAASDSMILWSSCSPGLGGWSSRLPAWANNTAPCNAEPRMELTRGEGKRPETVADTYSPKTGWIDSRVETFTMPTIEPGRLVNNPLEPRLPAMTSAFHTANTIDAGDCAGQF